LSSESSDINARERTLIVSGSLSPAYANETIVVYFSEDGISYNVGRTLTHALGEYSFSWKLNSTGTSYVRTSWSGNTNHTGADSEILTVFIGFPNSIIQFKGPNFFYTFGRGYIARHELQVRQGVEDFLDVQMSGRGINVTGEFIIVKSGEITIIPREGETKETLEEIVIPKGFQPLRLPDDIEHKTNNHFGFILENNGDNNYSLSVKGLDTYEVTKISSPIGEGTTFVNTSALIKENMWYKITAKISEKEVTAEVKDTNGTLIERISKSKYENDSKLVLLLTNNTDRAIAFKNLNIDSINQPTKKAENKESITNYIELLEQYSPFILLIATIVMASVYVNKRR